MKGHILYKVKPMSANFEINFILNKFTRYFELLAYIKETNLEVEISEILCIDNWLYENQKNILPEQLNEVEKSLKNGKIVITYGTVNRDYHAGFYVFLNKWNKVEICLFSDSEIQRGLDEDYVTPENQKIYQKIVDWLVENHQIFDIELCGIGVETDLQYQGDIAKCVRESKYMNEWILPEKMKLDMAIEGYERVDVDKCFVLRRKNEIGVYADESFYTV